MDPSKSQWSPVELSKILAEIHPLFEQKIGIAYKNVRVAWLKIDEDSSGSLDHEEFMALFSKFNLILRPEQRKKLFELFDPKQTGFVIYSRFNEVIGQVRRGNLFGPLLLLHRTFSQVIMTRAQSL